MKTKVCSKCKTEKSLEEFHKDKSKKSGFVSWCKLCSKNHKKYYREKSLERKRKRRQDKNLIKNETLKYKYGITLQQYNEILKNQNDVCKICGQIETAIGNNGEIIKLSVDHNHASGKIRGLLCRNCNTILGRIKDNIIWLNNAKKYLEDK